VQKPPPPVRGEAKPSNVIQDEQAGPAFAGAEARRHDALNRAVTARAPELPDAQRTALAGLLDVLWSPPTYERLRLAGAEKPLVA
jgi:hypothetical protein